LADYNKAIELNSNYAEAYNNRGIVYEYQEKWDLALADYTQAIKLNPNYADAYINRGFVYLELRDINKAREDFQRAAELYFTKGNTADYQEAIELLNSL
jgi:tetratricopeptide (TPR) repeat protein